MGPGEQVSSWCSVGSRREFEIPWALYGLGKVCVVPVQSFFFFCSDAVGVVECPSKASFPFTTSTSLSAPHVAFETIAVRQGGLLPDFLEPPGGNSRPPKRTHSDLEFFFLLMKLRLCGRWG